MEQQKNIKDRESFLRPGERLDDLQIQNYFIIQNPEKFCFGMDAVLLSCFTNIPEEATVADLGTGTGVLPILLAAKKKGKKFDAIEIQEESADMAKRSVSLNQLSDMIHIFEGDLKEASHLLKKGSYDAVVTNPPYMTDHHGLKNPKLPKAIARHEILCQLEDVIRESSLLLKPKKSLFMVHRPFRMVEIFETMRKHHLEPKRIQMVHPFIHKEPNMLLIEAVKDGNPRLKVEPPVIVYQKVNEYTEELLNMYQNFEI